VAGARNALAFTTVTDAKELTKWTGDKYLQLGLRSVDTYYFQVPDTGYRPGSANASWSPSTQADIDAGRVHMNTDGVVVDTSAPHMEYHPEAAGAAGSYQTETGGYKVIEYRPGHSN
jgi:hypothetical protein